MKKIMFGLLFSLMAFQVNAATVAFSPVAPGVISGDLDLDVQPFDEVYDFNLGTSDNGTGWTAEIAIQDTLNTTVNGFGFEVYSDAALTNLLATITPPALGVALADNTTYYGVFIGTGGISANGLITGVANPAVVPVPAAAWLFGSALMGMVGVSRRKSASVAA